MAKRKAKGGKPRDRLHRGDVVAPELHESEKPAKSSRGGWFSAGAIREIVESVVIAFVLAFLFRTFEAEAFVIPTGSMAPTLMGRHKDVICPKCGYQFQVSASDEVDHDTGARKPGVNIQSGTCPMCRFPMDFKPGNPYGDSYPSYKGDRILVVKFPYQFGDPERFDVAVFKFPGKARTNYIKRIVGLPGETIAISDGDLFFRPGRESVDLGQFQIARKPPKKLRAMLQLVYDNDHVPGELIESGWPARWTPIDGDDAASGWQASGDSRSFSTDGSAPGDAWIGYRHVVPSLDDWQFLEEGKMPPDNPSPSAQLITDFSAYNTGVRTLSSAEQRERPIYFEHSHNVSPEEMLTGDQLGLHWVGDLAVECELEVGSNSGDVVFELVEGGRVFGCRIDLANGKAVMSIDGLTEFRPVAETGVCGPGTYEIMFSNVDDELLLWVDGDVVDFDGPTTYGPLGNTRPKKDDLQPARIGSRGAAIRVDHLKIHRDIYYIAQRGGGGGPITDFTIQPYQRTYDSHGDSGRAERKEHTRVVSNPDAWAACSRRRVTFPLEEDQFLVLGDNSAESKDSRLWEGGGLPRLPHYVSRELLIGKALFIYWPHSLDRIPGTDIPAWFFPNFWRMWFVR
ncbi:MAG: signal peptidase I [Planctomycetota bacterium]